MCRAVQKKASTCVAEAERIVKMPPLMIVIVLLIAVLPVRGEDREDNKRSVVAEKTAEKMRQEIQAEIKTLQDHPWAGEYYCGDGLGTNISLAIAPKSGHVFELRNCTGLYDRNYGTVEWKNGLLRLTFTFENNREGFRGFAEELIPVAWGPRKVLDSVQGTA